MILEAIKSEGTKDEKERGAAANLVFDRTISRAGHNDIYARSDFHEAMRAALEAVSVADPGTR